MGGKDPLQSSPRGGRGAGGSTYAEDSSDEGVEEESRSETSGVTPTDLPARGCIRCWSNSSSECTTSGPLGGGDGLSEGLWLVASASPVSEGLAGGGSGVGEGRFPTLSAIAC